MITFSFSINYSSIDEYYSFESQLDILTSVSEKNFKKIIFLKKLCDAYNDDEILTSDRPCNNKGQN